MNTHKIESSGAQGQDGKTQSPYPLSISLTVLKTGDSPQPSLLLMSSSKAL